MPIWCDHPVSVSAPFSAPPCPSRRHKATRAESARRRRRTSPHRAPRARAAPDAPRGAPRRATTILTRTRMRTRTRTRMKRMKRTPRPIRQRARISGRVWCVRARVRSNSLAATHQRRSEQRAPTRTTRPSPTDAPMSAAHRVRARRWRWPRVRPPRRAILGTEANRRQDTRSTSHATSLST
jgi:hypothetical protein